jgi:uncharacterized membrane protein YjgN (DUF898 family)
MASGKLEFRGTGLGLLGIGILNLVLCVITVGLYGPWAYVSVQRWYCKYTLIDGRPLTFKGTGAGFFGQYLLICLLTLLTLTIYTPWGICRLRRWQTANTYFADPGDNEV